MGESGLLCFACLLYTFRGSRTVSTVHNSSDKTLDQKQVTVDGVVHEGAAAALTVANAAPPTSLLAHGHVGDTIPDGEETLWNGVNSPV